MSPILNLLSRGFGIKQKQKQIKTSIMFPILNLLTRGFRIKFDYLYIYQYVQIHVPVGEKQSQSLHLNHFQQKKNLLQYISVTVNRDV